MGKYKQANHPLAVTTPLGTDVLLLERFQGSEAISTLFRFELDLLAETSAAVPFDKLLGQSISVTLKQPDGSLRDFNGIVSRFSQAGLVTSSRGDPLVRYRAEMVPKLWLLTRNVQSRIFQQLSVPDILQQVLTGLDVDHSGIQGTFQPRDYCVQYRESDFAFASRLLEEEGIFYYFVHSSGHHKLILANTPQGHRNVPGPHQLTYEPSTAGVLVEDRILSWEKTQELRSGKYTLWDYCFELADKELQASKSTEPTVEAGTVSHKLQVGGNDKLEIYDFPGAYAQRFDGVSPSGKDQSSQLQDIFSDGDRTVGIRMQQEAAWTLRISGDSTCRQLASGCKFTLQQHFNGDGPYVLTRVTHEANLEGAYTGTAESESSFTYHNRFEAIPLALPYRPPQVTPKPKIAGTQTALVVGQPGDQVCCDKYGRIKVQFHWDRQGQKNASSSCWIRVAQVWAGNGWGSFFWPRLGHEVVVSFEEGDPDQPLIVGSVYNSELPTPFELPDNAVLGGIKSCSFAKDSSTHFNGIVFDDTAGHENLTLHGQNDVIFNAEDDKIFNVQGDHNVGIVGNHFHRVGGVPHPGGGGGGGAGSGGASSGSGGTSEGGANWPPSSWSTNWDSIKLSYALNTIYGLDVNVVNGFMGTYTLGSKVSLSISPLFAAHMPDAISPTANPLCVKAGHLLGNALTNIVLGTNTSLVVGPNYNIHYGPTVIVDQTLETWHGKAAYAASVVAAGVAVGEALAVALIPPGKVKEGVSIGLAAVQMGLIASLFGVAWASPEAKSVLEEVDAAFNDTNLMPTLSATLDTLTGNAQIAKTDLHAAIRGLDLTSEKTNNLSNRLTFTAGDYAQYAQNIFLVSTAAAAPAEGQPAASILVAAIGNQGQNDGNLVLLGTNQASLSAGPATVQLENVRANNGKVTIACDSKGMIVLQRGPNANPPPTQLIQIDNTGKITIQSAQDTPILIQTDNSSITLQTSGKSSGITLNSDRGAITLNSGGGNIALNAGQGDITLNGKNITLSGPANNVVKLDNQGNATVIGLNTQIKAHTEFQVKATQTNLTSAGQITATSGSIKWT